MGRFAALAYENEVGLFHHAQLSSALGEWVGGVSVLNKTVPRPFPFRSERLPVTLTASLVISTGRPFPRGLQTAGIPPPCPLPPPHTPLSHGPGAPEPRVLGATAVSTPTVHLMCQQPEDRFAGAAPGWELQGLIRWPRWPGPGLFSPSRPPQEGAHGDAEEPMTSAHLCVASSAVCSLAPSPKPDPSGLSWPVRHCERMDMHGDVEQAAIPRGTWEGAPGLAPCAMWGAGSAAAMNHGEGRALALAW